MTNTLNNFLKALPVFAEGIQRVFVATYNGVDRRRDGDQFTLGGKKFSLYSGDTSYHRVEMVLMSDPCLRNSRSLVVFYAGKQWFETRIRPLAYQLADQKITVVLVACGCKREMFDNLPPHPNISFITPMHAGGCNNGHEDLANIVNALAEQPVAVS